MAFPHRNGCLFVVVILLASACAATAQATSTPSKYCNCPATNAPVCGEDLQTYLNGCTAKCYKVKILANKTCAAYGKDCQKSDKCNLRGCICNGIPYNPVCHRGLTWINECDAQCNSLCPSCKTKDGICSQPNSLGTAVPTPAGAMKPGDLKKLLDSVKSKPAGTTAPKYNYAEALYKNFLYYESTRDGKQAKRRLAWRDDSCLTCRGDNGADLSKGYLEAGGSFLKMTQPIAYTVGMMAWSLYQYKAGYNRTKYTQDVVDAIRWGTDYLLAGHPNATTLIAQFNDRATDFVYFGPPELYDEYALNGKPRRYAYITNKVGQRSSEIAGETAAALALAALALKSIGFSNAAYIGRLTSAATSTYKLAVNYPGKMKDITNALIKNNHAALWNGEGYEDELAWASFWMWRLTKDNNYLTAARQWQQKAESVQGFYSVIYTFDGKQHYPAVAALLARYDPDVNSRKGFQTKAKQFFDQYLSMSIPHTYRGMAYPFHWGACRVAANVAALALFHSNNPELDSTFAARLFAYGEYQIKYLLGDSGRSWMVGFGSNYPTYLWQKVTFNSILRWDTKGKRDLIMTKTPGPWSKDAGQPNQQGNVMVSQADAEFKANTAPQRHIGYGTLYGAPLPDDSLIVGRKDYTYAEPQIDGNAGLTVALAHLTAYYTTTRYQPCKKDLQLGWSHPKANPKNQYPWPC